MGLQPQKFRAERRLVVVLSLGIVAIVALTTLGVVALLRPGGDGVVTGGVCTALAAILGGAFFVLRTGDGPGQPPESKQ